MIPFLSIGPLNSASQANAWARATESHLGIPSRTMAFDGALARKLAGKHVKETSDSPLPHYRLAPERWRRFAATHAVPPGSFHLNESNFPLFSDPRSTRFSSEVALLARRAVTSAVVFHGSDIRDPARSMDLNPHSFFHSYDSSAIRTTTTSVRRNREGVEDAGLPILVTTPDLLPHVRDGRLLPLTVDIAAWECDRPAFTRPVPRVLHHPSASGSTLRGSRLIAPVLDRLERAGRIEVLRAGIVPRREMHDLLDRADILIDQIQIGSYGVTAIEAMAGGRLVVGDVMESAREAMGGDVPIVNATPNDLGDVLDGILDDLDAARSTALAGTAYARRWHDGRAAAHVLQSLLEAPSAPVSFTPGT